MQEIETYNRDRVEFLGPRNYSRDMHSRSPALLEWFCRKSDFSLVMYSPPLILDRNSNFESKSDIQIETPGAYIFSFCVSKYHERRRHYLTTHNTLSMDFQHRENCS